MQGSSRLGQINLQYSRYTFSHSGYGAMLPVVRRGLPSYHATGLGNFGYRMMAQKELLSSLSQLIMFYLPSLATQLFIKLSFFN